MKKLVNFLLIFSLLSLSGCDFLRKVASRPTSEDLQAKSELIQRRRKAERDSLQLQRMRLLEMEKRRVDSLRAKRALDSMNVKFSGVFSFGEPTSPRLDKYTVILGVYRMGYKADSQLRSLKSKGFAPLNICFAGGVRAVALCSSDTLARVSSEILRAKESKVCPKDAWIYVKR